MSDVNLKKPLVYQGKEAKVIHTFASGKIAVVVEGEDRVLTFKNYGNSTQDAWCTNDSSDRLTNKPTRTVKYVAFYPQTGAVYEQGSSPIKTSMYGVDQIVQVKLTYEGDRLIAKEIV